VYRNIADFIENISIYASKAEQSNASRLVDIFNQRYPVEACDWWIQTQLLELFGLDIDDVRLDEHGIRCLNRENGRLLLLRSELDDKLVGAAIADFLGLSGLQIPPPHAQNANAGDIYEDFYRKMKIPKENLAAMLNSRLSKLFLSVREIEETYTRFAK
jgi:hypothetical protein